jgi:hypothetical protein
MLAASRTFSLGCVAVAVTLGMVSVGPSRLSAHDPVPKATWHRDVEPLFKRHCATCHFAEGPATPSLTTLEEVVAVKGAVKRAVLERRMPDWGAARGFGSFSNDPSLSPQQIAIIASWIEAGTPPGVPTVLRPGLDSDPWAARSGERVELRIRPFSADAVLQDMIRLPVTGVVNIAAWRFQPGDPTIREAEFYDGKGRVRWTWRAGSPGESFPDGTGLRLTGGRLEVRLTRRTHDAHGNPRPPKKVSSVLSLWLVNDGDALHALRVECHRQLELHGTVYALRAVEGDPAITTTNPEGYLGLFSKTVLPTTYWLRHPIALQGGRVDLRGQQCSADVLFTGQGRVVSSR